MTGDRIVSLDAIGFTWAMNKVHESNDDQQESTYENSECKRGKPTSFIDCMEQLKAYKAQHGHLNVKRKEDVKLHDFCHDI